MKVNKITNVMDKLNVTSFLNPWHYIKKNQERFESISFRDNEKSNFYN